MDAVPLCGVAPPAGAPERPDDGALRIVTLNVLHSETDDGDASLGARLPLLADAIVAAGADVVGAQEVTRNLTFDAAAEAPQRHGLVAERLASAVRGAHGGALVLVLVPVQPARARHPGRLPRGRQPARRAGRGHGEHPRRRRLQRRAGRAQPVPHRASELPTPAAPVLRGHRLRRGGSVLPVQRHVRLPPGAVRPDRRPRGRPGPVHDPRRPSPHRAERDDPSPAGPADHRDRRRAGGARRLAGRARRRLQQHPRELGDGIAHRRRVRGRLPGRRWRRVPRPVGSAAAPGDQTTAPRSGPTPPTGRCRGASTTSSSVRRRGAT